MMVEETSELAEQETISQVAEKLVEGVEVRVLTLNIWGIPRVSRDLPARIDAICQQICSATEPYHVVFLQEVWSSKDYSIIAEKLKTKLPHSHYFYSGVIGSGLCVFSSTPLTSVHFHLWSVNGLPHKVYHGDWWGGKGVALCRTELNGCPLLLATTHLHAVYHHLQDEYLHHRVVQAFETSQLLDWCSPSDHTLLMGGDLNCQQHEVPYRLLRYNARLRDAFADAPNKPVDGVGATNETPGNSYTSLASLRADPTGKRIDHVLYRPATRTRVSVQACDLPWPLRVPGAAFSFSDHEAVRTVFRILALGDAEDFNDVLLTSNGPSFLPSSPLPQLNGNSSVRHNTSIRERQPVQAVAVAARTLALHQQTDTLLDSAAICAQGLRSVESSRKFYCVMTAALILQNLVLVGLLTDGKNEVWLQLLLICLLMISLLVSSYCMWLVLVWNRMERNGVLATQLGLHCLLDDLRKQNAEQFKASSRKVSSAGSGGTK